MEWIGARAAKGFRLGIALAIFVQAAPLAIADQTEKFDAVREFAEAYDQIKSRYADRLDEKLLVANAIKGMVSALDPFSYYLEPDAYNELRQETGGVFGGLGMEVSLEKGAVKVITAFEDSPAHRAGLQAGDLITRFGETDVAGLTLDQALQYARGEPDSSIALTVLSKGVADPRIVTVKRAIVQARSVKSETIDSGYFYLKITHFHKHTAENMLAALAGGYQQTGGLKGVVLDLRDNPGGLLKSAVAVSAAFLPEDTLVVYTESVSEQSRMRLLAKPVYAADGEDYSTLRAALKSVPLVVLVNGSSASAAEIVAGALQSHHRATIVGTKTFGKGSVQVILPLSAGSALKLTTAYYSTPDGRKINGIGLMPDIAVEQSPIGVACSEAAGVGAPASKALAGELAANVAPAEVDCQFDRAVEILRRPRNLVES